MANEETSDDGSRKKIQGNLPIRAVGIETKRERKNYSDLPPQNYVHVWWARRPTPATRLGILSSILPETVDDDTLLGWIGINPSNKPEGTGIAEHVRKKAETVDDRDGFVYEHYGYRKAYKNLPTEGEMEKLHETVRGTWNGELPTLLDATAGGGSIPFESVRYGLPTIANELNPVASVILKAVLEHPRVDGDLSSDIQRWGERINEIARDELEDFFPPANNGEEPVHYLWAHTITCPDCGLELPLSPNWWIDREPGSEGLAVRGKRDGDNVSFELVTLPDDVTKSEYNPTNGTVSRGKASCFCGVVIDGDEVKRQFQEGESGYQLYCVEYRDKRKGNRGNFRAPEEKDIEAFKKARERVENDPDLSTFLSIEIPQGNETKRLGPFGMEQWRDMYSPRQLLTHHTYLEAFQTVKEDIRREYPQAEANAILTFLAIAADKALSHNCRQSRWDSSTPKIAQIFDRHDFAFKWSFAESNLTAKGLGYEWVLGNVLTAYEDLKDLSGESDAPTVVMQEDAANLPIDDGEVDVVVLDPPYYDNVMYAELSDFFYVWLKHYLGDVYPEFFQGELTDKHDEAVANPAKFEGIAGEGTSKREMAKQDYEQKMTQIFDELHRVLQDEGIFTLMFTHKRTEAWDTLTKALINSGFIVTSTHPVSTENPHSLHQAGKNAAESTILLSSEKKQDLEEEYTLWGDIKKETNRRAQEKAEDLDSRDIDFAKVDMILASFGPTLEVFTENYPVIDDEGNQIEPQTALDEARAAVQDYFIDKYLNEGVRDIDNKTEWYILAWLIFEAERFPYDEARRLAIGMGEELSSLKRTHRLWRKKSDDIVLRSHDERVQTPEDKDKTRTVKPVDPEAMTFATDLDKVHAAMYVYESRGAKNVWNFLKDRNLHRDSSFKATLEALLRVLPRSDKGKRGDWEIARDLTLGETGDLLDLDLNRDIFKERTEEGHTQSKLSGS